MPISASRGAGELTPAGLTGPAPPAELDDGLGSAPDMLGARRLAMAPACACRRANTSTRGARTGDPLEFARPRGYRAAGSLVGRFAMLRPLCLILLAGCAPIASPGREPEPAR